jgi:class 3 adenylate cyclase
MWFLFSDLAGCTQLWQQHPEDMKSTQTQHDAPFREAVEAHRCWVVKTAGVGLPAASPEFVLAPKRDPSTSPG